MKSYIFWQTPPPPLMKLFHLKMIFFCDRFPYGEFYLGSQKVWQVPSICGPRFDLPDLRHWRWHPGKILELCALAVCPLILTGIAAWYVVLIHFFFVLVLVLFSSKKKERIRHHSSQGSGQRRLFVSKIGILINTWLFRSFLGTTVDLLMETWWWFYGLWKA